MRSTECCSSYECSRQFFCFVCFLLFLLLFCTDYGPLVQNNELLSELLSYIYVHIRLACSERSLALWNRTMNTLLTRLFLICVPINLLFLIAIPVRISVVSSANVCLIGARTSASIRFWTKPILVAENDEKALKFNREYIVVHQSMPSSCKVKVDESEYSWRRSQ